VRHVTDYFYLCLPSPAVGTPSPWSPLNRMDQEGVMLIWYRNFSMFWFSPRPGTVRTDFEPIFRASVPTHDKKNPL